MTSKFLSESTHGGSNLDIELSQHCKKSPELYLQAILDASASCIAVLDESGNILYVNRAWRQLAIRNGLKPSLQGAGINYLMTCRHTTGAGSQPAREIKEGITQILLGHEMEFEKEYVCEGKTGRRTGLLHAARFDLPDAFRVLITDDELKPSPTSDESWNGAKHSLLLSAATDSILWEADAGNHHFTYVGEQAAEIFGYPIKQWYEAEFWVSHIHPEDQQRALTECLKNAGTRFTFEIEYRMIAKDGSIRWLRDTISVVHENDRPKTLRGFLIDITERKNTEEALINLSGRLINAQEEERKRIARELHDDLNQRMALISIELSQLEQKIQKPRNLFPLIHSLQIKAQEVSAEIHNLSYELHPSKLDHLGLSAAIESLCKELSNGGKLNIAFSAKGFPGMISKDVRLCVFRIAQESLRNCTKHSGAGDAQVWLERTAGSIRLTVRDNGRGFNTNSDAMKSGLGFTSMQERIRLVDGEMQVFSSPSSGTSIEITIPYSAEPDPGPWCRL